MSAHSDSAATSSGASPHHDAEAADERAVELSSGPAIQSLEAYIAIDKGTELPRRLLRHMLDEDRTSFSRDEVDRALRLLPDADPDLRRVRSLLRLSRQKFDGRFERTVLDFARAAVAPLLDSTRFQDVGQPANERFREVVASQRSELRAKATGRRALNIILLALDILADAGLSMEEAIPILRQAVGEERQPTERWNPRRERLAQLADSRMTIEQLRRILGLIEPWERMAIEARAERDASLRVEVAVSRERDAALEAIAEREGAIERLETELQAARQEAMTIRDQLKDAGSVGRSDVASTRARALSLLQRRLRPTLETAREAAEVEQPNVRVMRRMILDALHDVDEEIKWLTSSD